ncbi:MAG: class I SAM-dependent methyltransferase, partial [Chloroflexi bacterium CFX2]|nr:class I SAM-dependent methyltransferase [Chloroflexi bacterium CFX2]
MDSRTTKRLIELNRDFYEQFAGSFSATRQRLQPGVRKILDSIGEDDSVLDLGCGNGLFLRELHKRGHRASLLGADFSLPLLREAESTPGVGFKAVDLAQLSLSTDQLSVDGGWDVITMFATLHHIPANEIRLDILRT